MKQQTPKNTACRSVFRTGADTTTIRSFTQAWVRLINQQEKNKAALAGCPVATAVS